MAFDGWNYLNNSVGKIFWNKQPWLKWLTTERGLAMTNVFYINGSNKKRFKIDFGDWNKTGIAMFR